MSGWASEYRAGGASSRIPHESGAAVTHANEANGARSGGRRHLRRRSGQRGCRGRRWAPRTRPAPRSYCGRVSRRGILVCPGRPRAYTVTRPLSRYGIPARHMACLGVGQVGVTLGHRARHEQARLSCGRRRHGLALFSCAGAPGRPVVRPPRPRPAPWPHGAANRKGYV